MLEYLVNGGFKKLQKLVLIGINLLFEDNESFDTFISKDAKFASNLM